MGPQEILDALVAENARQKGWPQPDLIVLDKVDAAITDLEQKPNIRDIRAWIEATRRISTRLRAGNPY